ncbi:MAG: hypothetical protein R2688_04840 [Fimbriimonadaceae bacterium]
MNEDKKKAVVLGVLVVVMLGVGAFTFMGKPKPAPVSSTDTATEITDEGTELAEGEGAEGEISDPVTALNEIGLSPYSARDPFETPAGAKVDTKPPVQNTPPPTKVASNTPPPMSGGNKPFNPLEGWDGPLPTGTTPAGGGTIPGSGAAVELKPKYRVMGVIVGAKSMAVFEDSDGNQKLVPVGGAVDGDTKVTAIERGKVTVSHRGKQQTLVIQEEAKS